MSDLIEHYRNPGGWIDFWIGLVVFIFFFAYVGHLAYQHDQVIKGDIEFRAKHKPKD